MNYLINIYLAPYLGNKEKVVGNTIAEFIKYSKRVQYAEQVEEGIFLNNSVWNFMKDHPAFIKSKSKINPKFTRYSNDIVKMFYSHFLAANFEKYSDTSLETAIKNTYLILLENYEVVPSKLRKMLPMLTGVNGLSSTKTVGGVHNFIVGLGSKGYCVGYLQNTLQDLLVNYGSYKEDFEEFMVDFKNFAMKLADDKEKVAILANAS